MSDEVFKLVQSMDLQNVEMQLALYCAPVITGIKMSNLLTVKREQVIDFLRIMNKGPIGFFRVYECENSCTYLLFRRPELERYLERSDITALLMQCGYQDLTFGAVLQQFRLRYIECRRNGEEFPHEIGVLLGYPIEDVEGFIYNKGKKYLYSGYWKVYGDIDKKKQLFQSYEEAKECLIQSLYAGTKMRTIIERRNVG